MASDRLETQSIGEIMEFGFAFEISPGVLHQESSISAVENSLKIALANKSYGAGVKCVTIGLTIVPPDMDDFFSLRAPRYFKGEQSIEEDGLVFSVDNLLELDLKMSYARVCAAKGLGDIAAAIQQALQQGEGDLLAMHIENFNAQLFFDDVMGELRKI